jgi:mannose-1-phosphate guanylyltransferase
MINIVLAGGSGTRLWPLSRMSMPKQFIKFLNDKSLFQLTIERNMKVCENFLVVTNTEQYFLAKDQLESYKDIKVEYLLETIGRNTAPSITLACLGLDEEEIVLVTPCDHLIKNEKEYEKVINQAKKLAQKNYLVTFGIKPLYAETGYGYIEVRDVKSKEIGLDVIKFHEKPDKETAEKYINKNKKDNICYLWNSGMFCFKAGVFLNELKKYAFEIYDSCKKVYENAVKDKELIRIKYEDMIKIPENSIDYAVMEKSKKVKVIPADIKWNDLGSFDALYEVLEKDNNGNTKNNNLMTINSKNNFIYGNKKIATIDIEDLIVVDTADALLISKRGSSQKVKEIVKELKKENSELYINSVIGYRPWGTYTILEKSNGYKIKRIEVKPGKRLSLQKHFHRNEHWIVVSGTAEVEVEDKKFLLRPNESTYIKMGEVHRLSNPGKIPLILIEIQVGEYTGEDDIVRIEDDFDRIG